MKNAINPKAPVTQMLAVGEPMNGIMPSRLQNRMNRKTVHKYVPFLWTVFLFILFCNLLGMIPFMGSPTASIWVTGALGLIAFFMMHGAAIAKMGFVPYVKSL